jgi:hypothetical protein
MKIKETNSCDIADNRQKSSQGAVQKDIATKLVEPKRYFASSRGFLEIMNIMNGLDSDSSYSGSDSSSGEFDFLQ